jgi:hypothetical protein
MPTSAGSALLRGGELLREEVWEINEKQKNSSGSRKSFFIIKS